MRNARRLVVSAILLGLALFISAPIADADSGWQNPKTIVALSDKDSGWQ